MKEATTSNRFYKLAMSASFLLLTVAVVVGYRSPAAGYELDIYRSTPVLFWLCLGIALVLSTITALVRATRSERNTLALFSTTFGVVLVAGLPYLRGYYHVGNEDMMTHYGWTMELITGVRGPESLFYPTLHTITGLLSLLTGLDIGRAFHLISLAMLVVFFMFIPLCARRLSPRRGVFTLGLFAALFLLPINHVTTDLQPNPRTVALFLLPVVFFGLLYSLSEVSHRALALVIVLFTGLLLAHPQYAVGLLFFLAMFLGVLWASRSIGSSTVTQTVRALIGIALAYGLLAWLWIENDETFTGFVYTMAVFLAEGRETAAEIGQRGGSLLEIGGSLGELFMKIYLIPAIFCIIVAVYGAILAKRFVSQRDSLDRTETLVLAFTAGIIPFATLALFFGVTNRISHLFRFAAFAMAIVTIVAPIGIREAVTRLSNRQQQQLLVPVALIFLAVSVLVMFPSPYIYNDSKHVSETNFHGYETAFEYTDPTSDSYTHTRTPVGRYGNALEGPAVRYRGEYPPDAPTDGVPDHFNNHALPAYYDGAVYLMVPIGDKQRDLTVYDGFRFNEADFAYLDQDSQIQKVQSNGEVEVYYVTQRSEAEAENER